MTAASVTWVVNRAWTFSDRARVAAPRQWLQYLGANLFGFGLYYATYGGCILLGSACRELPGVAGGGGNKAGLFSHVVAQRGRRFRHKDLEPPAPLPWSPA